jgi:hypothetical protein
MYASIPRKEEEEQKSRKLKIYFSQVIQVNDFIKFTTVNSKNKFDLLTFLDILPLPRFEI